MTKNKLKNHPDYSDILAHLKTQFAEWFPEN